MSPWVADLTGVAMRVYRRSPAYPWLGRRLGQGLGVVLGLFVKPGPRLRRRAIGGITFELDLREVIDASLFFAGEFEPHSEQWIRSVLVPGGAAIDVGANVGYLTLIMAKVLGAQGRVVAIEPSPRALQRLRRNLSLNDPRLLGRVELIEAVASNAESSDLQIDVQSSYPLDGAPIRERVTTKAVMLDALMERLQLQRVDLIKCDVDGAEKGVFDGAWTLIERDRPALLFELTPAAWVDPQVAIPQLLDRLCRLGYVLRTERGQRLAPSAPSWTKYGVGQSLLVFARIEGDSS